MHDDGDPEPPSSAEPAIGVGATTFSLSGGHATAGERRVAVEAAVNLCYGTMPYAVMMATPDDLEDFAAGFSLTEGIVEGPDDIRGIKAEAQPDGIRLMVDLVPARFHTLLARRRAMRGRTSCGVCGIEDFDALPRARRRSAGAPAIRLDALRQALAGLSARQVLHQATGAMHAAAWAGLDGAIGCAREDVGRHNALDKLIGALMARRVDPASGFVLVTSRCSYEMVEKAASFGAATVVAVSAPTSLGVERARHHGMTLIGIARHDTVTAFSGAERIIVDDTVLA